MKLRNLIIIAASVIALLLTLGSLYLSSGEFNPQNIGWDGLYGIFHSGGISPMYDLSDIGGMAEGSTLFIIAPSMNFTAEEAGAVSSFLNDGGRVVVMDDYGTSNSLLEGINSPIRLNRVPLCQDKDFYKSPAFPNVRDISPSTVTSNVTLLVFNHPVPLSISGDASVIAATSGSAWLDYDDDRRLGPDEKLGQYPLIASTSYGRGELIVVGDPDLFINAMIGFGDNGVLMKNLLEGGEACVDVSHGMEMPLLARIYYIVKYSIPAQILVTILLALIVYASYRIYLSHQRKDMNEHPVDIDVKRSIITYMKLKLPLQDKDINELNKKL